MAPDPTPPTEVRVWDLGVRLFHWGLVASMLTAYLSTEKIDWVHKGAGYAALALVVFRGVWGFVSPSPHARFVNFVPGPRKLAAYLGDFILGREPRHLGHNPAGAAMMVALMLATLTIAVSGWLMTTDWGWGNETVETVHTLTVEIGVWAVAAHVSAAVLIGWRHWDNLVLSMFTGRKRRD